MDLNLVRKLYFELVVAHPEASLAFCLERAEKAVEFLASNQTEPDGWEKVEITEVG